MSKKQDAQFPEKIYVGSEELANEEELAYEVAKSIENFAYDAEPTRKLGIYKLERVVTVKRTLKAS